MKAFATGVVALLLVTFIPLASGPVAAAVPVGPVTLVAFGIDQPSSLALGPDGNVWFTDEQPGSIGRITPDGALSRFVGGGHIRAARYLTPGPEGDLWFVNAGDTSIGKISVDGEVTSYTGPGIGFPGDIVAGPDGNLWFTNYLGITIGRITPAGVVSTFTGPGIENPLGITVGADGALWFANNTGGSIGRITTDGVVTNHTAPGISGPQGITLGPDGNVWFANTYTRTMGRITPAGDVAIFADPGITKPLTLAPGPDGNVWFTNGDGPGAGAGSIGKITPTGIVTTYAGSAIQDPDGIVTGADGNLWFSSAHSIGRATPDGDVTSFTGGGLQHPDAITPGPDGNLWFINTPSWADDGSIGRVTPAGIVSNFSGPGIRRPVSITQGPDGNLWFTSDGNRSVNRMTVDGAVTMFPIDSGGLGEIVTGPDGNLWFTNDYVIGRITPNGVITNFEHDTVRDAFHITPGPDGALWFTYRSTTAPSIGRITPDGAITTFTSPAMARPGDITTGLDGNLWFSDLGNGTIGRITPTGVVSTFATDATDGIGNPVHITTGPDGSLWFTHSSGAAPETIGRITRDGMVSTVPLLDESRATDLVTGPDGQLWITGAYVSSLAKMRVVDTPGPPTDVTGEAGVGAVAASWSAPVGDEDAVATYLVTAEPGGATCTWSGGPLSCTVHGLTKGTAYQFTVTATNGAGTSAPSAPSEPVAPLLFSDVSATSPFFTEITWMGTETITLGYPDGTFRPAGVVARNAMAAFLYRYEGSPNGPAPTCSVAPYPDVPVGAPFCGEISWVEKGNITDLYTDGGYHPNDPVARQAMAAFLYRLDGHPNGVNPTCTVAPYPDVPVGAPFCGEISWATTTGIATGYTDGGYHPNDPVTRQAMAAFLHRLWLLP